MNRRQALHTAALGGAAAIHSLADTPAGDRPGGGALPKKITSVECISLEKPLSERFWMSVSPIGGFNPTARRIILKIHTDTGVTGYGEGRSNGLEMFKKGFADLAIGRDPFMVGELWERMFSATYGRESAKKGWSRDGILAAMSPVDAALYDIMAKSVGLPVYKMLGAYRHTVPVYVTGGYYREGKGTDALVKEIAGYVEQGFNAVKLKVGGITGGYSVEDDYQRIKAVREAIGPNVRIMLDANKGWDVDQTIRACNLLYDLDITWMEEPLHWYDAVETLKRVKMNTRIPLASGEGEIERWGARRLMDTGVIDFLQFDCHRSAGPTEWRKMAGMASMMHVKMAPHHEPPLHGHLLASVPNAFILESFANPERDPLWFEIYDKIPRIEKSVLYLDDTPGFGIEFNAKALERYGTKIL